MRSKVRYISWLGVIFLFYLINFSGAIEVSQKKKKSFRFLLLDIGFVSCIGEERIYKRSWQNFDSFFLYSVSCMQRKAAKRDELALTKGIFSQRDEISFNFFRQKFWIQLQNLRTEIKKHSTFCARDQLH